MIGAVDSVAIAELQAARSHHAHISAGGSAVWRDDDVPVYDDLLSFNAPAQRYRAAVVVALDDFAILSGEHSISGGNGLARIQVDDTQTFLVRLLDVVPLGRYPRGILVLGFHREAAARRLEAPLSAGASHQLLPAACRDRRFVQHLPALLVPEMVVRHADDDIWLIGGGGR